MLANDLLRHNQTADHRITLTHISSTGAIIPLLILSIKRYCSSHFNGAGWGFSSESRGNGFLLEDLGVVGRSEFDGVLGVRGVSSFGFLRGDGEGMAWVDDDGSSACLVEVALGRVDLLDGVRDAGVSGNSVGSCLIGVVEVIKVTRGL